MSLGHDVRRHSQQHRDAAKTAQWSTGTDAVSAAQELSEAKYERKQWRQSTFWCLWHQSTFRAIGFIVQEACCQ